MDPWFNNMHNHAFIFLWPNALKNNYKEELKGNVLDRWDGEKEVKYCNHLGYYSIENVRVQLIYNVI